MIRNLSGESSASFAVQADAATGGAGRYFCERNHRRGARLTITILRLFR